MPLYDAAVHAIAELYLAREMTSGHEGDLAYLRQKTLEIDEVWRQEGFEGATPFLANDGQYVAIGRRLHDDEREDYAEAWASDSYPFLVDFCDQGREQTFRILFGGEVRDVTVPAQFQARGMRFTGFDGTDGMMYLYMVGYRYREPDLSEDMAWLVSQFGTGASINYNDDHFTCLSVQSPYLSSPTFPSLEDVATVHESIKAARSL